MGRQDRQRQNLKRIAIGSSVAAVAGYVAGVLTAPKSGKQTRDDIKVAAERSRTEAEKDLKRLHTDLDKVIKDAKEASSGLGAKTQQELNELIEKAKDTKEKTREVISAIHEGDAEDKDLARAVKNANTSLKHLRNYLKK
ncbi:MAG TPA: YtxH domain-containing protein [Candidatus Saccharimonadales bacterium]